MTLDEFLAVIDNRLPPAPPDALNRFETSIGTRLPEDYREFLIRCNGGYARGYVQFRGPNVDGLAVDACINHIGGFREEGYFSLESSRVIYQINEMRIPRELIWIADDPFGNAICLGILAEHRGRVYFWDHENEPGGNDWDGSVDLLANSFTNFLSGLHRVDEHDDGEAAARQPVKPKPWWRFW